MTQSASNNMNDPRGVVLVTGATGYVGGRLVPALLRRGWRVRCLTRSARKLEDRAWCCDTGVEIVEADVADTEQVEAAMRGCSAAYYLVHSMMAAGEEYRERDRRLAESFAAAAASSNLDQIIYLGGLGEAAENLSEHLASRREVEDALHGSSVPVTVLRAAMIIGAGSASFEILRYLVERLPVMVTPHWVSTASQPIAIDNVIEYLVRSAETPEVIGRTLDIGGPDILTYRQLMDIMADERGLRRRLVIPVPVLTPRLSSLWIHLVTPLSSRIARPLAEGLRNRVVCRNDEARQLMPQVLLTAREAIARAVGQVASHRVETSWTDAGPMPGDPDWAGGTVFVDRRSMEAEATQHDLFLAACRIGGGQGYYAADWLWKIRGMMDRLAGGPGLRRGRRDPETVGYGDALDFWRVTAIERESLLELRAEMKLPGVATLTFEIEQIDEHRARLIQTARFKPRGLLGLAYWYAVVPLHGIVFSGMLKGIARAAERRASEAATEASLAPSAAAKAG